MSRGVPQIPRIGMQALTSPSTNHMVLRLDDSNSCSSTLSSGPSPRRNRPQESSEAHAIPCGTLHCCPVWPSSSPAATS